MKQDIVIYGVYQTRSHAKQATALLAGEGFYFFEYTDYLQVPSGQKFKSSNINSADICLIARISSSAKAEMARQLLEISGAIKIGSKIEIVADSSNPTMSRESFKQWQEADVTCMGLIS